MSELVDDSSELCDYDPPDGPDGVAVELLAEWRTDKVRALAWDVREELAQDVPSENATNRMSELADAFEEAGCDCVAVLNHCRRCPAHHRDCWVIGLILPRDMWDELPEPTGPVRQAVDRVTDRVIQLQVLVVGIGLLFMVGWGIVSVVRWMFPNL